MTGATFTQVPGGKGANQALAAVRLGATVSLVASVGGVILGSHTRLGAPPASGRSQG